MAEQETPAQEFLRLALTLRPKQRAYFLEYLRDGDEERAAEAVGIAVNTLATNWIYRDRNAPAFRRCVELYDEDSTVGEMFVQQMIRQGALATVAIETAIGYRTAKGALVPARTEVLKLAFESQQLIGPRQAPKDSAAFTLIDELQHVMAAALERQHQKLIDLQAVPQQITEEQIAEYRYAED